MPRGIEGVLQNVDNGLPPLYFAHVDGNHYLALEVRNPYTAFQAMSLSSENNTVDLTNM